MSASIHQIVKVEIIKYLLSEPYATASTIATALERPIKQVQQVLTASCFYCDVKGNYALLSEKAKTEIA